MKHIIYEVELVKGSSHIVSLAEIFDLVGNEKSTQGDTNCLSDLVSTRWHQFGWGAKKGFCTLRRYFQFRMILLEKMLLC